MRCKSLRASLLLWAAVATWPCTAFAQSGWVWQNPYPTANSLTGVAVLSPQIFVAVGDSGSILRTTDGGETWTFQPSGTDRNLVGVSFVDQDTGFAVGTAGTVLRTTDGGITWTSRPYAYWLNHTFAVSFVDADNGWLVGT